MASTATCISAAPAQYLWPPREGPAPKHMFPVELVPWSQATGFFPSLLLSALRSPCGTRASPSEVRLRSRRPVLQGQLAEAMAECDVALGVGIGAGHA